MVKILVLMAVASGVLSAQAPDLKSVSGYARFAQATLKRNIVRAAEKMPEESYGYQPTPDVRTFGQLIGHIANSEYGQCSAALGEKNPNTGSIEKEKTSKADLVAAVTAAFAYCDQAYAKLSDEKTGEAVKVGNNERNRLGLLFQNNTHINEHYGNLVTYMRLKGIVPPSSEPR